MPKKEFIGVDTSLSLAGCRPVPGFARDWSAARLMVLYAVELLAGVAKFERFTHHPPSTKVII